MCCYKQYDFSDICKKIREWIILHRDAVLLAWFAEYGFSPGKAVIVEEHGPEFKTYIRECTAEEGERAQTAANTGSPKFPTVESVIESYKSEMKGDILSSDDIFLISFVHDYISRKLRAGA